MSRAAAFALSFSIVLGCDTGDGSETSSGDGARPPIAPGPDGAAPPPPSSPGSGEVLTSRNDNERTGANLAETALNHTTVGTLALAATLPVDGELYAQPLVVTDVATASGAKTLVIAATMNDSVYAYDLDAPDGAPPVWRAGARGELGRPGVSRRNVVGPNGILSTPVVDRARGVLWVVSRDCSATETTTFDRCGTPTEVPRCRERLSAVALATGEVQATVVIEGGTWSDTRLVAFDPSVQWNRPALLLEGDSLFVAFGSGPNANDHEEDYEYHGWLFRYDARSITSPPVIFNTTPRSSGGSVWQAGSGPASDGEHVYFVTANDVLGCSTHAPSGFPASPLDAEDSIVRVPIGYLATDLRDAGTPPAPLASEHGSASTYGDARVYSDTRPYTANGYTGTVFQFTNSGDVGFGSSGPMLIPGSRDLVVGSKGGLVYLLDRDTMLPRQAPLSPFDRLELQGDHTLYIHSWWGIPALPGSLAFYRASSEHGLVYGWPKEDKLRSFRYDYAARTLVVERVADVSVGNQGGYLSVSADGTLESTAILWATTTGEAGGGRAIASTRSRWTSSGAPRRPRSPSSRRPRWRAGGSSSRARNTGGRPRCSSTRRADATRERFTELRGVSTTWSPSTVVEARVFTALCRGTCSRRFASAVDTGAPVGEILAKVWRWPHGRNLSVRSASCCWSARRPPRPRAPTTARRAVRPPTS